METVSRYNVSVVSINCDKMEADGYCIYECEKVIKDYGVSRESIESYRCCIDCEFIAKNESCLCSGMCETISKEIRKCLILAKR